MLSLLVLAFLFSTALAATPCCPDRQYEAVFGEIGGAMYSQNGKPQPALINGENVMHYDYYNRKMAMENTLIFPNGTNSTTNILIDYNTDLMYIKLPNGDCWHLPNTVQTSYVEQCISANAVHVGSSYIGYGVNEIPFTTWQFFEPKNGQVIRMSVTDQGCIPIVESIFGTVSKGSTDLVFIVTGYRPGIRKTSLLEVPKNCPLMPANFLPGDSRRAVEKLEKLVKFY